MKKCIVLAVLSIVFPSAICFGQGGPSAYQWQQNQRIAEQQIMQQQQLMEMQRQTRAMEDMAQQQRMNQMNQNNRGLYQPIPNPFAPTYR
jgi:hypothetical protein